MKLVLYVNTHGQTKAKGDLLVAEEVKRVKDELGPGVKVVGLNSSYNELIVLQEKGSK